MSQEELDDYQNRSQIETIEVQRRLLAKTKTDKTNALLKKNTFDTVGSNGIFGASPSIVKFAGFEILKTHTLKVRLINNSPAPQRLHILPPQTQYFKIKYNKKGMVPAGIAEEIYVQFTPNDEYKYYYDCIRIHCDGDKILIPIHAFPVINSKKDEIFPNFIDMGKHLKIGETYTQTINIESNCPVNFEYDIEVLKAHPDIMIYPVSGDILGMANTQIQVQFTPSTFTTAEAEISFRTTEFDSQSKICRIVGNALPQKTPQKPAFEIGQTQQIETGSAKKENQDDYSVKKTKSRTLLTGKRENRPSSRAGIKLDKLPEKAIEQSMSTLPKNVTSQMGTQKLLGSEQSMPTLKNLKLTKEEQDFTRDYRRLEDLEREKGIKFFQCIGDPPITDRRSKSIKDKRSQFIDDKKNNMRERDIKRYQPTIDEDRVVVDTNVDITEKPKWDAFENNHFAMRRRLVFIFLKNCNKLITRMRAEKRLVKIRVKLQEAGVRNREDAKKMVAQDWKSALNLRMTDGENEDNIQNIKFTFNFNTENIQLAQKKLPVEYETNISSFMEKVEANPPISFDDLVPYETLEQQEFEIQKYQKFPQAQMSQFDPVEADKIHRPGCEYESLIRSRRGEPELEKIQTHAFDQQKLLKKPQKDIASGAIVNMPSTFQKPFDYSIDLIVKSHPTLREYVGQRRQTEIDQDYHLNSYLRQRQDPRDEIMLRNNIGGGGFNIMSMNKSLGGSFVKTCDVETQYIPGNFGVRVIEQMPTNLSDVWRERKTTQLGLTLFEEHVQMPYPLGASQDVDYPTDEDSDSETKGFAMKIPELSELLNEFEKDDDTIAKQKEAATKTKTDSKTTGIELELRHDIKDLKRDKISLLESNISVQMEEQNSRVIGMLEDVNETIKDPKNKIYLR